MRRDRNQLQRTTLDKIKKVNELQKDELIDIVMRMTDKAIDIINERGGEVEHDITETLAQLMVETGFGGFKKMFTQEEVGVTRNTLNALGVKNVLEYDEPFGLDGAGYWKWTGKELEVL